MSQQYLPEPLMSIAIHRLKSAYVSSHTGFFVGCCVVGGDVGGGVGGLLGSGVGGGVGGGVGVSVGGRLGNLVPVVQSTLPQ